MVLLRGARRGMSLTAIVVSSFIVPVSSIPAQERPRSAAIARDLKGTDGAKVMAALSAAGLIPLEEWNHDLRQALADAIVDELKRSRGAKVLDDHHQMAALTRKAMEIARAGDPVVIPALIRFPVGGWKIYEALEKLGEPAFVAILDMISSFYSETGGLSLRDDDDWMYSHGLLALAFFVDHRGADAFGDEARVRMEAAVRRTLNVPLHEVGIHMVVPEAMWLGIALGDSESLEAVRTLTDANEVRARGVTDPQEVEQLRRRATDVLAGRRPLPWPRPRSK